MPIFSTENTKNALTSILSELKKALRIFLLVSHIFFVGFYTYNIISNSSKILLIVVNSLLLILQLFMFGVFLFKKFKNNSNKRIYRKTTKYIKYSIQFTGIVYNFVIYFVYKLSTLHIVLTIVSLIMLFFSIMFEIVVSSFERYAKMLSEALVKDYEESSFIGRKLVEKTPLKKLLGKEE